jgi:hypothetical protein
MVPVGWVVLLRRERADILEKRAKAAEEAAAGAGGDGDDAGGGDGGARPSEGSATVAV